MFLFLPPCQKQLKKRMLIIAKTPPLQPQKQSNVAWQTTPVAISPRIQAIEGETELMHQEDSLTASHLGSSGRGKKQTLHTNNIEGMRRMWLVSCFYRLCILMSCPAFVS
jgi:hypothetical protein